MIMVNLVEIGKRLKEFRKITNLTQTQVADFLSIDQSMVAKLETGERSISSDVLEKLSTLFCCTLDDILVNGKIEKKQIISFRKNNIESTDLKTMATINRIVLNQFEMDELVEETLND
jgi:transcriptional regulator with XRE-family HTH domain